MIAQMMRAVLLASAIAATRAGFRASKSSARGSTLSGARFAHFTNDIMLTKMKSPAALRPCSSPKVSPLTYFRRLRFRVLKAGDFLHSVRLRPFREQRPVLFWAGFRPLAGLDKSMLLRIAFFLVALLVAAPANAQRDDDDPFAVLSEAYARKDAAAAAGAYAQNGIVVYAYAGTPEERVEGRAAIMGSFQQFFDQFASEDRLDLNFRMASRTDEAASGIYRLRYGRNVSYGLFEVRFSNGLFAYDRSADASAADFETLVGPVRLRVDDEELDRSFYSQLVGRYHLLNGCDLVVTRSVVRLFVRNTCTHAWRGLTRVSGLHWTAGDRVLAQTTASAYRFATPANGQSPSLEFAEGGAIQRAVRRDLYRTESVSITSADGVELAGTVYIPANLNRRASASVLIHGSGPQDRDGYASIMAVFADELASNGRIVLAFDKRGNGDSGGDGDRAGFDMLAQDVIAAMTLLRARPDVDPERVGIAGSSQAGWVAATVVEGGGAPSDVFLLGAAGAAFTVEEQNLYNTEVQMRCAGIGGQDRRLALNQQRAFFRYLRDPRAGRELDLLTERGRARAGLSDWLFPDAANTDRSAGAWYVVLDPNFDPLPVWRTYAGRAVFIFSEHDDATPTPLAVRRLRGTHVRVSVLRGAQHLGLTASALCEAGLGDAPGFAPELFRQLEAFARSE